jgi:hypothetical protein
VDNEQTAAEIIKLNKEIKGPSINIFPLSWINELKDEGEKYVIDYP